MYNTADNMEDLDIPEELYSYDTVMEVLEHHQIFEKEYQDADFVITVSNKSETNKIKGLLDPFGYKAYIVDDDDDYSLIMKIGFG